jgi:hypothetical protein
MRRVVITGLGTVNPIANDVASFDAALRAGTPGGGPITCFDITDSPVKIGCEVKGFDPENAMDKRAVRRTSRFIHLAVAAAREAVDASGLDIAADPVGVEVSDQRVCGGRLGVEKEPVRSGPGDPHVGLDAALAIEQRRVEGAVDFERLDVVGHLALEEFGSVRTRDFDPGPVECDPPGLLADLPVLGV